MRTETMDWLTDSAPTAKKCESSAPSPQSGLRISWLPIDGPPIEPRRRQWRNRGRTSVTNQGETVVRSIQERTNA